MTLCSLALVLALGISAASSLEVGAPEWRTWKLAHGKRYGSGGEDNFRLKIFIENQARIAKHNRLAAAGKRDYFLKMNHFGDLLHHEFVHKMNGYRYDLKLRQLGDAVNGTGSPGVTFISPANVAMPESFDWREKGAVTPVKDQGQCGSCWAFSSTGALEGQTFRATGKLISLSEQNLVDCSTAYGNNGCNGGLMDNAFQYIKDNGGIDTEVTYPYEAEDDKCRYNKKNKGASDKGFVDIPKGDEDKLAEAIASMGPVSVAIDASHESFQFYSHGVYSDPACDPANLDHGVLAVGYGVEADGTKYWLVKNSWSEKWGDKGYIKILRQGGNMCGVASAASYPLV